MTKLSRVYDLLEELAVTEDKQKVLKKAIVEEAQPMLLELRDLLSILSLDSITLWNVENSIQLNQSELYFKTPFFPQKLTKLTGSGKTEDFATVREALNRYTNYKQKIKSLIEKEES